MSTYEDDAWTTNLLLRGHCLEHRRFRETQTCGKDNFSAFISFSASRVGATTRVVLT